MFYQTEHIEENSYQKPKSMTTALGIIKCSDGIVLASDSQGSTDKIKILIKKIHEITKTMGLVGAGDYIQIIDLVNVLKERNIQNQINTLSDLDSCLLQLHEQKNIPHMKTVNPE